MANLDNIMDYLADHAELRTLLWENPNTTSTFTPQDVLTQDLTEYDEIEVFGMNYTTYGSIMPSVRIPRGGHGNMIGLAGSSGDATGTGYLVARGVRFNDDKVTIYEAKGVSANSGNWTVGNNNMIPYRVYGIKKIASA